MEENSLKVEIHFTKYAEKQIKKLPPHIHESLLIWMKDVLRYGLYEVRKTKGFHDEPLHGIRQNQRSVRLNKAYRVIYLETKNGDLIIVSILEVNKHEY